MSEEIDLGAVKYWKEGSFMSMEENVGIIKINRPEALNSMNEDASKGLVTAFDALDNDPGVRVIIITGEGEKAFCVGADVKMFQNALEQLQKASDEERQALEAQAREMIHRGHLLFNKMEQSPKPIIAALNGLTLGGGLEIALACDIRIAAEEVKLGFPEVSLGLFPAWGGTQRVPKLLGIAQAKELILTGSLFSAKEAKKMGLVSKIVPRDELMSTASFLAAKIADNAPVALQLAKDAINQSHHLPEQEGYKLEEEYMLKCINTEDALEGIRAVVQKRKPQFKGS